MNPEESWKDPWKLDLPGHAALWELHQDLRRETKERWDRSLPFGEELFDRWERAAFLGFGPGSSIYDSSVVMGTVEVGRGTWVGPFTVLDGRGGLSIGSYCSISSGVHLYSHDSVRWALTGGRAEEELAATRVEDCCYVGPHTVVARGVTIGHHSVIGTNSFVRRDIPPYSFAVGSPARITGRVTIVGEADVSIVHDEA
jgi:acetyltransferase-like isoleucine patch superfamily enzyme